MRKIYIIVPVYNVEKYLTKCLDSIFNQTYKNYFVICINDGSTDNSLSILKEYCDKHSNMVIINKSNGGLSSSRNAGLDYIKDWDNSLITYLDSDDYLSNDFLETLESNFTDGIDIVCSNYYDTHEDDSHYDPYFFSDNIEIFENKDAIKLLFEGKLQSHAPCKLYKASLWKDFRYDVNSVFMEDQCSTFQIFLKSSLIKYIPYSGYYYVHRIGSLCQSRMTNKKILSALNSYLFNYNFNFNMFGIEEEKAIKKLILQEFTNVYLMMVPRFDDKNATKYELEQWENIRIFVKNTRAVLKFKPKKYRQFIKKATFCLLPHFYKKLFKHFLKEYDN